jgi:hypothetical protein
VTTDERMPVAAELERELERRSAILAAAGDLVGAGPAGSGSR